eukprot:m.89755 g.89755  ORF g.89755 m.89755 type:complete len:893 (-) comp14591_c0_seq6:387-3065(-)
MASRYAAPSFLLERLRQSGLQDVDTYGSYIIGIVKETQAHELEEVLAAVLSDMFAACSLKGSSAALAQELIAHYQRDPAAFICMSSSIPPSTTTAQSASHNPTDATMPSSVSYHPSYQPYPPHTFEYQQTSLPSLPPLQPLEPLQSLEPLKPLQALEPLESLPALAPLPSVSDLALALDNNGSPCQNRRTPVSLANDVADSIKVDEFSSTHQGQSAPYQEGATSSLFTVTPSTTSTTFSSNVVSAAPYLPPMSTFAAEYTPTLIEEMHDMSLSAPTMHSTATVPSFYPSSLIQHNFEASSANLGHGHHDGPSYLQETDLYQSHQDYGQPEEAQQAMPAKTTLFRVDGNGLAHSYTPSEMPQADSRRHEDEQTDLHFPQLRPHTQELFDFLNDHASSTTEGQLEFSDQFGNWEVSLNARSNEDRDSSPDAVCISSQMDMSDLITDAYEALSTYTDSDLRKLALLNTSDLVTVLKTMLGEDDDADGPGICKYYLKGSCTREHCFYSHDLKSVPCKFFQSGWCVNGSACPFQHDHIGMELQRQVKTIREVLSQGPHAVAAMLGRETQPVVFEASPEDFPSLTDEAFPEPARVSTNRKVTKTQASTAWSRPSGVDLSSNTVAKSATVPLPNLAIASSEKRDELLRDVVWDAAKHLGWKHLLSTYPQIWEDELFAAYKAHEFDVKQTIQALAAKYGTASRPSGIGAVGKSKPKSKQKQSARGVHHAPKQWVSTGQELSQTYLNLRGEAIEEAKLRNKLLQQATQAYIAGNPAEAKRLSRIGREHDERMKVLHRRAAETLFTTRNKVLPDENMLDLHGLHVKEAIEYLSVFLDQLQASNKHTICYVITGTGHHSQHKHLHHANTARLLPAIQRWLSEHGYSYTDASTDKRGGMLCVTL